MQKPGIDDNTVQGDVSQLSSFLRGEMAAVDAYRQCLAELESDEKTQDALERVQRSHANRAQRLRNEIQKLGGHPADDPGAWGAFAKLLERGAALVGWGPALDVLEEGERHGRRDYEQDLGNLSTSTQELVARDLLPEQVRTQKTISALARGRAKDDGDRPR